MRKPGSICSTNIKLFLPAILALFLNRKYGFDPNVSTALYHSYEFLLYFLTIFGAIIAESWLGMFRTLALMNFIYSVGSTLVAVGGIETLNLPFK